MKKCAHIWLLTVWIIVQLLGSENLVFSTKLFDYFFFPEMVVIVDSVSVSFLTMVCLVSVWVFIYSFKYIKGSVNEANFYVLLSVFCASMLVLSLSADVFWSMVGWDGLGFSSFLLVIYYQNWNSVSGGLVTFLTNRFGDLFMLLSISGLAVLGGQINSWCGGEDVCGVALLLLLSAMTKSAQVPFSAWLPMAIAAPTPVSSLVHSSTLVTAGVFIVSRFSAYFAGSFEAIYLVSSLTIVVAGSSSIFEWDLNKVVALSTLLHIALMLNLLSLGSCEACLFHMQIHAYFNSLLFISCGVFIHESVNWQDLRRVKTGSPVDWVVGLVSLVSMVGFPFVAGFFSKEIIMIFSSGNAILSLPFWLGVFFTFAYSVRILVHLLSYEINVLSSSAALFQPSSQILAVIFAVGGATVSWSLDYNIGALSLLEGQFKAILPVAAVFGLCLGLSSVFNHGWANNESTWSMVSYVYFFVHITVKQSWVVLNVCDIKGYLDWGLVNVTYGMAQPARWLKGVLLTPTVLLVEVIMLAVFGLFVVI